MNYKYQLKKPLTFFTVFSILLVLITSYSFLHIHIDDDGNIVTHSHPYGHNSDKSSGFPSHHHSNVEFYVFNSASVEKKFIIVYSFNGLTTLKAEYFQPIKIFTSFNIHSGWEINLRAPPCFYC